MEDDGLPAEVQRAKEERPDCSYSVESSTRINIVNGDANEVTSRRYYQACPGERRRLLHASEASRRGSADELSVSGRGDGLRIELPFPFGGSRSQGHESNGGIDGFSSFPSIDDFIRDFLGARHDDGGFSSGRIPFPFPLPRPQPPPQLRRGNDGRDDDVACDPYLHLPEEYQPDATQRGQRPPAQPRGAPSLVEREKGRGVYV